MSWFTAIAAPKVAKVGGITGPAALPHVEKPPTLISSILSNLQVKREPRDVTELHASDLTKEDFCVREVALAKLTGVKKKAATIDAALAVTFDLGHVVSDLVREKWLGSYSWGNWVCQRCGKVETLQSKPPEKHEHVNCTHLWKYVEVMFSHPLGWTGSIDVFARLDHKLTVVEIKTMNPDDFEALVAPLAEHRLRTALYLRLIADADHPYKDLIHLDRARVLYVSRAFGKKNPDYDNKILPFKEYELERDDAATDPFLADAARVKLFLEKGVVPPRIKACEYSFSPRAKSCGCMAPCFSGKFH